VSAGPYTVIASHVAATEAYGYETQIVYMLAKNGEIVADDGARVSFETERVATDGKTGKLVADITRYTYRCALCRDLRAAKDDFAGHPHRVSAFHQASDRQDRRLR
jgi:hypothetical protein